jgi:MoaA/NifB/PqqE/SkfB family radical SAM enzyme
MSIATEHIRKKIALDLASLPVLGAKAMEMYLRRKYNDRVVTPAKVKNFIQAQRDKLDRATECKSLPWIINLDTFSGCNLKCPFCPTGTDQMGRPKRHLPIDHAKRVIDSVKEHAMEIRLYNWGEPFLNPDIFEIIRYARDAGLFTVISSNLSVKVKDLARLVVASGLDRLTASIDGVSQHALETYRRRADAQLCFDNIKAITDERASQGAKVPSVELRFLVFRHNEHELEQLEAKRREVGADVFEPRRAFIFHDSFVPEHADFQPLTQVFQGACDFLYSELTVEATGAISPCCTNTSSRWDVGTIADLDGGLRAFWNAPIYRAMRAYTSGRPDAEQLAPGQEILCKTCDLIDHPNCSKQRLSPLPPSFRAIGITYRHDLDRNKPADTPS